MTETSDPKPEKKTRKPRKPRDPSKPVKKKRRVDMPKEMPDMSAIARGHVEGRNALRNKVKIFYDIQSVRLRIEGRLTPKAEGAEIQLHEADKKLLGWRYREFRNNEASMLKDIQEHLETISFYRDVLSDRVRYRGIGPTLAGVILSEFDIHKADTVSKMWSFSGLNPVPCRRCRACHTPVIENDGILQHRTERKRVSEKTRACPLRGQPLTENDYYESGALPKPVKGEKLRYNEWLRSKMMGVLGPCLIKLDSPFRRHYEEYKHRKLSQSWGISPAHVHNAAMHYMVKMVLLDIHSKWRKHEGLSVREPYAVEKLGMTPHVGGMEHRGEAYSGEELDPEVLEEIKRAQGDFGEEASL